MHGRRVPGGFAEFNELRRAETFGLRRRNAGRKALCGGIEVQADRHSVAFVGQGIERVAESLGALAVAQRLSVIYYPN
jgi:hypothetical protein